MPGGGWFGKYGQSSVKFGKYGEVWVAKKKERLAPFLCESIWMSEG